MSAVSFDDSSINDFRDRVEELWARATKAWRGKGTGAQVLRYATVVVAYLIAMDLSGLMALTEAGWSNLTPSTDAMQTALTTITNGGSTGLLYGMIGVGLILIYRTNRIINFAVVAVGALPAVFFILLTQVKGVPWIITMPASLVGGALIGGLVEIGIIRRFASAPRLILTVATLGISQLLAFIGVFVPIWLGTEDGFAPRLDTPFSGFSWSNSAGVPFGTGDNLAAAAVVIGSAAGLGLFFRKSKFGIALRASAENADRASLLGVPVKQVGTLAWVLSGVLGAAAVYFRSPVLGTPVDVSLGFTTLLFALSAAVIAKMESIPIAVASGVAIGIIEFSTVRVTGESSLASAIMLVFILVALLFQRNSTARAADTGVSTFKALQEFRSIPPELRHLRELQIAKFASVVAVAVLFLGAPLVTEQINKLQLLPIYAMVGLSLVVLSGWAGQISLGQFAFVGIGAVTASKLYVDFGWDFWFTLVASAIAGAIVAILVGLPAVRVQGLLLAVASLGLAAAAQGYLFQNKNENYIVGNAILPSDDIDFMQRPILWERVDLNADRAFYYFCVVLLFVVFLAATSYRRHHGGRLLIATRDNVRAAQSYSINLVKTRLAAFAVSGAIAAMAGALLVYQQKAVDATAYGVLPSINVFMATVIGGLTSLAGAMGGVIVVFGIGLFGDNLIDGISLLVTGPGLLMVLLFLPGGLAEGAIKIRDAFLRSLATKHGIVVPSLFADMRTEDDHEHEDDIIHEAEEAAERHDKPRIVVCPVCQAELGLEEALDHEHLRAPERTGADR